MYHHGIELDFEFELTAKKRYPFRTEVTSLLGVVLCVELKDYVPGAVDTVQCPDNRRVGVPNFRQGEVDPG